MRSALPMTLTALALGACSLAPPLEQPALEVPAQYKQLSADERGSWKTAQPAEAAPRGEWWIVFDDPILGGLIVEASNSNQSLKSAVARVAQARALLGVAAADRSVEIGAGAGPTRSRPSAASQGLPQGSGVPAGTVWRGLLTASYEVDLFGRVANSVDAARSDYDSQMANLHSVLLALQADVAQTYFALREFDEELGLLRETVKLRTESVRLFARRFDLGDISELDLARARTELGVATSDAIALERQRAELEHALAILLGKPPAAFELAPAALIATVPRIPAGLPSALLERRPDIAAAQRSMAAANARIGVARSAFFPQLQLTAQGGFESAELGDLFKWSSRTWVLGPLLGTLLSLPLIDGGRNQANLDRSYAVLEESVADYRQRVLVAFGEVENRLVSLRTLSGQADATRDSVTSATRAYRIADSRFQAGAANYLEVIDAQRSLLSIQRLDTRIKGERATATVALIRSLGGGWSSSAAQAPALGMAP